MSGLENWTVRAGRREDLPAMDALDRVCFQPPFRFSLRAMRRFALAPGAIVRVAEQERTFAGFIIVQVELVASGPAAYIVTLDVAPEHRRLGLAGALVQAAEAAAAEAGAQSMLLHVFSANTPAISFYEAAGYGLLGEEAGFYGAGLDALVYAKSLVR